MGDIGPDAAAVDEPVDGRELHDVALVPMCGAQPGDALGRRLIWVGGRYLGGRCCGG